VERCVEFTPTSRIAYVVDDESFGVRKFFADYGFAINPEAQSPAATRVILETHYTPRSPFYGLLNRLVMRRRFEQVCTEIVGGLKAYTESRRHPDR
jgi:hypothetical protein